LKVHNCSSDEFFNIGGNLNKKFTKAEAESRNCLDEGQNLSFLATDDSSVEGNL
jgi:hypothetical protein